MSKASILLLACAAACVGIARADFNYGIWTSEGSPIGAGVPYYVCVEAEETSDNSACSATVWRNGLYWASASSSGALNSGWETTGSGYFYAEFSSGNNDSGSASVSMDLLPDTSPPTVPTGLVATNISQSSFTLSWSASSDPYGVTGYEVMQDASSLGTSSALSRAVTGLSPTVTYSFKVRARDAAENWSGWSATLAVTPPDQTAPSAPQNLSSTHTAISVALSWSAASDNIGVVAYDIYRTRGGVSNLVPPAVTGLSFSDTHVQPNTAYSYTVKARDAAGNSSAASNTVTLTTSALADADSDGIPDPIEALFGNVNPTPAANLQLNPHRPAP